MPSSRPTCFKYVYGIMLQCNTLQHTATHFNTRMLQCNTLQHTATYTATHTATHCNKTPPMVWCVVAARAIVERVLQYGMLSIVCCSVLQCVAVCCSVLQCVAVCCSVLQYDVLQCGVSLQHESRRRERSNMSCCSVLQCVAVCCSTLQCGVLFQHIVERVAHNERTCVRVCVCVCVCVCMCMCACVCTLSVICRYEGL